MMERPIVEEIRSNISQNLPLIHAIVGPRQTGKTTAAQQVAETSGITVHWSAADEAWSAGAGWLRTQWEYARQLSKANNARTLLVVDEIQKANRWSEAVKHLWDEDRRLGNKVTVMILGSSSLLIQQGLSESLAGRFLLYRCQHWGFAEMRSAFGMSLDEWLYFGGYPGAAPLRPNHKLWRSYIMDSLIDATINRDIFQIQTVAKPALFRNLFMTALGLPAQIVSYNKLLGQLQDAGNTTTLAHYLHLLETAFLISGLAQFRMGRLMKRSSSPKIAVWNNALVNASQPETFEVARANGPWWGRIVENAVGLHLLNSLERITKTVYYWRDRDDEVDFVVKTATGLYAIEVKSGHTRNINGLSAFCTAYPAARPYVIGADGIPLESFFATDPNALFV